MFVSPSILHIILLILLIPKVQGVPALRSCASEALAQDPQATSVGISIEIGAAQPALA